MSLLSRVIVFIAASKSAVLCHLKPLMLAAVELHRRWSLEMDGCTRDVADLDDMLLGCGSYKQDTVFRRTFPVMLFAAKWFSSCVLS